MLSVHAALAIEKANLYERSRELSIVEERNRLARELHDSVTQKLFGLTLTAEAAATVIDRDPVEAKVQLRRLQELTREAMEELRSLIFELRPGRGERGARNRAAQAPRRSAERARRRGRAQHRGRRRAPRRPPRCCASPRRRCRTPCATRAQPIELRWTRDGRLRVAVTDDGVGFDPDEPGCARAGSA